MNRVNQLEKARVTKRVNGRLRGCELDGIRGNLIRLAALNFVDSGDIQAHKRLANYHNALCADDDDGPLSADPSTITELIIGRPAAPQDLRALFRVHGVTSAEAAQFLRDVATDWHCLRAGVEIAP